MLRTLRFVLRKFYFLLAIVVIVLAVVVQLGRNFSYLVSDYQQDIASLLSEQTNTLVSLDHISAHWDGLQPTLIATGVSVEGRPGVVLANLQRVELRLDLLATVLNFQPVWSNVVFSGGTITINQTEDGGWHLQGVPKNTASGLAQGDENKLLNILLAARRISFDNTQLNFAFRSGDSITLLSPNVLIENRKEFHRLLVNVDVEENQNALFFLLESIGDPRDIDSEVSAYLQLRDFPLSAPADVLSAHIVSDLLAKGELSGRLDASVWLTREQRKGVFELVGDLALSDAGLPMGLVDLTLESVSADVSGQFGSGGYWQLGASSVSVSALQHSEDNMTMSLSQAGAENPLLLQMGAVNLEWLNSMLLDGGFLHPDGQLEYLFESLDARGELRDLALVLPTKQPDLWQLSTYIDQVNVGPWNGAPGASGVSGFVTANARQGVVQLDAYDDFSLDFDGVYDHPMYFDRAKGQVSWLLRPDHNKVDVYSGRIDAVDGREKLQGQFHLSLPYQRNTGPIHLTISATAQNLAAMQYRKYLPQVVPESLHEYLDQGIGNDNAGIAKSAQFVYRGILNERGSAAHNVALDLDVSAASFDYHENWPQVHDVTGRLVVDNNDVHARIETARIYNSEVADARVTLTGNPDDRGAILEVSGLVDGIASDGLRVLRQSVLRKFVGEQMDTWFLHGDLQAAIDIAVPLVEGAEGSRHSVVLDVNASSFDLDNLALELDDFSGRISYDDKNGIRTSELRGALFNRPLALSIRSDSTDPSALTIVEAKGEATAEQIAHWAEQPALLFAEGEIPFQLTVELNHQSSAAATQDERLAAISVEADLSRSVINLPAPLGKAKNAQGAIIVNYILGSDTSFADVHYLNRARAMLHLNERNHQLISGAASLNSEPQLPVHPGLHFSGELETLDVAAWRQALRHYQEFVAGMRAGDTDTGAEVRARSLTIPISTDLLIQHQPLGPVALTDVRVRARQMEDGWDFLVNNKAITGELFWPDNPAAALQVAIEQLDIPAQLISGGEEGKSWTLTGTELWPKAQVSIDSLRFGGSDYGQWSFNFRPDAQALNFENILGNVRGIDVEGIGESGASLIWSLSNQPITEFAAQLRVPSMAHTLESWGAPPSLESENSRYLMNLSWIGSPADVSLEKLNGRLQIEFGQGRYFRSNTGASDGLLKFLGLFNFDSLARRARLDFSDLYKSGLAFDSISGAVEFAEGKLTIADAMRLQSPSSRMELTGTLNLKAQTLDTRLVATLPMTGNLTVIAALAAGLPAAAGVFVISKLFEEQMNKMTSVRYAITGDWDDPVTEFIGVADDE
ncbi:AsmA-like C-terminal region-containing protein [Gilvimarinus sp. SDUM040013]|uniref:AsmA-like C-terminal region-containing protein n=1 Tax=Gilvimarinus gilvus TaxID=3058038 RepID=A0ABU4RW30_9GAMM|nr:AsmA-like C-terminal region-containing protein [Gilvimarinus sp. SDUM040013]MDO3388358.1 AsmA-like C-terminal region-containing protein [Gilvimarinus sp. SDUM040013]MDX6847908.1 AsmA-like C-terminal region-containing protein [Gilvimarinus sp. SDUM040013]